jgi:hypothetical protein
MMRKEYSLLKSVISLGIVSYSVLKRGVSRLGNKSKSNRTDEANQAYSQDSKEQTEEVVPQFEGDNGYILTKNFRNRAR